jgi:hypothetical protein
MVPLETSDQLFGNLNKKPLDHPYQGADIRGYTPATPWAAAPAAVAELKSSGNHEEIPVFPTVETLDNEIDSWPESINPFKQSSGDDEHQSDINTGASHTSAINTPTDYRSDQQHPSALLSPLSSIKPSFAHLLRSIISSQHKLFFIKYKSQSDNARIEWKLITINMEASMSKHPQCLQDGHFIADFFIQHPYDNNLDLPNRRFWLEYHKASSQKLISHKYHIIQPSDMSARIAKQRQLVPYQEWVDIKGPESCILHGPFNFSKRFNRQSRDRIACVNWDALINKRDQYNCLPPRYISRSDITVSWNTPSHYHGESPEVTNRISCFLTNDHFKLDNETSLML